jgi:hypothetical protein
LRIREEKVREVMKIVDRDHCAFEGTKMRRQEAKTMAINYAWQE